jgi:hypothetical protein
MTRAKAERDLDIVNAKHRHFRFRIATSDKKKAPQTSRCLSLFLVWQPLL